VFRSILVPLDGSAFAEQSLPLALAVARGAGATLHFVQVHAHYELQEPVCGWLPYDPVEDAQLKQAEQSYLDALALRLRERSLVPVTTAVVAGLAADGILSHGRACTADLIVMSTHGRGPLSRAFLGSVADQLVRQATIPVLLVRPQEPFPQPSAESVIRRILVALDGSQLSEQILGPAVELGRSMGAAITLLHALPPLRYPADRPPSGSQGSPSAREANQAKEACAYLEGLAERLREQSLDVQVRVVHGAHAATVILGEAAGGFDLVALTTHGRGGFKRLFLGSVADKVIRGAPVPVLVYRPTAS
jgi:nucleotide-binding universal stress UspA family protein